MFLELYPAYALHSQGIMLTSATCELIVSAIKKDKADSTGWSFPIKKIISSISKTPR
jgi:hypothetical protein